MGALAAVAAFLVEHSDLIELAGEAITKGVTKETLLTLIRKSMVEASDAEMKREFPNG